MEHKQRNEEVLLKSHLLHCRWIVYRQYLHLQNVLLVCKHEFCKVSLQMTYQSFEFAKIIIIDDDNNVIIFYVIIFYNKLKSNHILLLEVKTSNNTKYIPTLFSWTASMQIFIFNCPPLPSSPYNTPGTIPAIKYKNKCNFIRVWYS